MPKLRFLLPACAALFFIGAMTHGVAQWTPAQIPPAAGNPPPAADAAKKPRWYRCFVRVPENMVKPQEKDLYRDSIVLHLGGLPSAFTVWLNGQQIAAGNAISAGERRRFKVPKGILEGNVFNVLALRFAAADAVIGEAPILQGYFEEQSFAGAWETFLGEPDAADWKPLAAQPATAFYTESGFHPAATPLATNAQPMPGVKLPPAESLAKMTVPDDLTVELVAAEPDIAQPTHVSFDERGRMWVAQYRQYPFPAGIRMLSRDKYYRAKFDRVPPAPPYHDRGRDRITVHESTRGDGVFDKVTVVLDGLNMANAVLRGHGGLWVMHTPYLLFYPDANGDDVPDRDPEVRLAGFGLEDTHSVANGLVWGPDGWLYGVQGSTTTSRVTRPGVDAPDFPGVYHEGVMAWRYHPERKIYEIFADGGGNAFEAEFDAEGRLYSGHNGGQTFGWHFIQEGIFLKQGVDPGKFGPPTNPYAFGNLGFMKSRNPIQRFRHATIVAEGTALPTSYQGRFFGADPLHRNVVAAERYPSGSTFETSDSATVLAGADPSFRPVFLANAPDGAIYVADFCEEYIAHGQNYQGQIDPESGRIFRVRGKNLPLNQDTNLAARTSSQLVGTLSHPNRWHRQTAVRLLAERRDASVIPALQSALRQDAEHPALEALWALHQLGALDEATALAALAHRDPIVRAWAIRLPGDERRLSEKLFAAVQQLVATEGDAEVRCQVASTARRLPAAQALPLVTALLQRDADADDPYIPLMCWWTLESHATEAPDAVIAAVPWSSATVQKHIAARLMRRFAAPGLRADLLACARLLEVTPRTVHPQLMAGFEEAFRGRAIPPLPDELLTTLAKFELGSRHLRVRLREPEAVAAALATVTDAKAKIDERLLCVRLLGEVKIAEAAPVLLHVAETSGPADLCKAALTSLLLYDDASIAPRLVAAYPNLPPEAQPAAQTFFASRAESALAFLRAIESGGIDNSSLPAAARLAFQFNGDPRVAELARRLFQPKTEARPAARAEIERVRAVLASGPGDPYKGEPIFLQRCAACHTLFFKGGRVGPDLTPYQRDDFGTLLISVIDPNAEIREGFVNQTLTTTDGRTLNGFVSDRDGAVVVIRGLDGQDVSVPRAEVRELRAAAASLMPEGLLTGLSDQELRDFFAYLRIPQPITK